MMISQATIRRLERLERRARTGGWTGGSDALPLDVAKLRVIIGMLLEAGVSELGDSQLGATIRSLLDSAENEREEGNGY